MSFLHFGYCHLLRDSYTTDLGDNATMDTHSTALLCTFEDPLLLKHMLFATSSQV